MNAQTVRNHTPTITTGLIASLVPIIGFTWFVFNTFATVGDIQEAKSDAIKEGKADLALIQKDVTYLKESVAEQKEDSKRIEKKLDQLILLIKKGD